MNFEILEWIEKISLSCQEGTSDKVWHAQLLKTDKGFVVMSQHGKRIYDVEDDDKSQSSLQKLTKPDSGPTTYDKAKELFDEKIKEKVYRKRYVDYQQGHRINTGSSIYNPEAASKSSSAPPAQPKLIKTVEEVLTGTGYIPQLLNQTTPGGCESMLADPLYYASPKADGIRYLLGLVEGQISASNRRGEGISVPSFFEAAITELVEVSGSSPGLCLDGEQVGNTLYVFDLLELNGEALSPRVGREQVQMPYFVRARQMERLAQLYGARLEERGTAKQAAIKFLPIARTEAEKRKLYHDLLNSSAEGMVFTHVQSILRPGKPSSGGDRFKMKFVKEIDCIVKPTDKRSFECFVYHNAQLVSVGYCGSGVTDTIYQELLASERRGETRVAVVRYLYATGTILEGGKIYQSTFLHFRSDKKPEECLAGQMEKTNRNVLEEISLDKAA